MSQAEVAIDSSGDIWILVPNSLVFSLDLGPGASWVRHGQTPITEVHSSVTELADATGGIDLYNHLIHIGTK